MLVRSVALVAALLLGALTACSSYALGGGNDEYDSVDAPPLGACRDLRPEDLGQASNASEIVPCEEEHTAETFAVRTFPERLAEYDPDHPRLGSHVYETCSERFEAFLDGDESTVMRSMLTWAWFRPSDNAWKQGARWFRCDVVGGGPQSKEFQPLPETARGMFLAGPKDKWMTCADGDTVAGSVKIPCSAPHTWRAVTTIKLGDVGDPYPGDRAVEVQTRAFCSDSVGAWMNYPVDYDFGYTFFHEAEWKVGNRRSICWAKTDK